MTARERLDGFYKFACERLDNGASDLSLDELYWEWRVRNPATHELKESVAAIEAAYAAYLADERGVPAREHHRELCRELGIVIDE
jgi:hypothetical protein